MKASELFCGCLIQEPFEFENFGRVDDRGSRICTYAYDKKYLKQLNDNIDVVGVITTEDFAKLIDPRIKTVITEAPAATFFGAYDAWVKQMDENLPTTQIDDSAIVDARAMISNSGVVIGKRTRIEAGAIVKQGVIIGDDCIIRSGAVIGGQGFEVKTFNGKPHVVSHGNQVIICDNVEVQYNSCIDRGMLGRDTVVGRDVKIDNFVHIAHGVHIGEGTKIAAGAVVAGRADIGKAAWIGPGCTISNTVKVDDGASITLGSTVVMDVKSGTTVTGYFAIEHSKFFAAWRRFRSAK